MDKDKIFSSVDHTVLIQTTTWQEIKDLIDDAITYNVASVCISPSYVKDAFLYANGKMAICTVIGFPNGCNTTTVKCFETAEAIKDGASEIDMVINLGWVKDKKFDQIKEEIIKIKEVCKDITLKVIIETCLLTDDEKIKMCEIVSESGADFIKTSTGFSTGGATFDDVALFAKHTTNNTQIKAAGGISSFEDAEKFLNLGATRLGTSRIIKLEKQEQTNNSQY